MIKKSNAQVTGTPLGIVRVFRYVIVLLLLFPLLQLTGCSVGQQTDPVKVTYLGNSCFIITSPDGTQIVSDPYYPHNKPAGLSELPADLTANAVTVSHTHPDHNNFKAVNGDPQVLNEPGNYQVGDIKVTGYPGYEGSPQGPNENMPNTIFVYESNDVKIVQLGDSGIVTDPEILTAIENADIVIVNIDGYVIDDAEIMVFMQQISAHTVILAHYTVEGQAIWNGAPTADEFVTDFASSATVLRTGSELEVTPGMPEQIAIMTPLTLIEK